MKVLPRAQDVDVEGCSYGIIPMVGPALTGWKLKLMLPLSETAFFTPIRRYYLRKSGVPQVLKEIEIPEEPMLVFEPFSQRASEPNTKGIRPETSFADRATLILKSFPDFSFVPLGSSKGLKRATLKDYHHAYKRGDVTPLEVAERVIQILKDGEKRAQPLSWLLAWSEEDIRRQAKKSTQRYKEGKPLSPIDGVPFSVKDIMDALPYATVGGSEFSADRHPVLADTPSVAQLRCAGAMVLGKSNCHEFMGSTGVNTVHGTPGNPWNEDCYTGGSSSGCVASTAAGLCPMGTGHDTGGSIRHPASWTGIVGLLPTRGRISKENSHPADFTNTAFGPMAGCMQDLILMYGMMAKRGGEGTGVPPLVIPQNLDLSQSLPLSGLKMGIYWEWFNDADVEVVEACRVAVALLEKLGVELESVKIPELQMARVAHCATVGSEMLSTFHKQLADRKKRAKIQADTRSFLHSATDISAAEYLQAQRVRARTAVHFKRVLDKVDFIVTPTVAMTAPPIRKGATRFPGETCFTLVGDIIRFMSAANFVGLPALSLPVGKDCRKMPIGLQMIGRHWQEATLLRSAYFLEAELEKEGLGIGYPDLLFNPLDPRVQ